MIEIILQIDFEAFILKLIILVLEDIWYDFIYFFGTEHQILFSLSLPP